jgi:hypothetical protein
MKPVKLENAPLIMDFLAWPRREGRGNARRFLSRPRQPNPYPKDKKRPSGSLAAQSRPAAGLSFSFTFQPARLRCHVAT